MDTLLLVIVSVLIQTQVAIAHPCSIGYYRIPWSDSQCTQCPNGTSTVESGATSMEQCFKTCSMGYYTRVSHDECIKCPIGYYDERDSPDIVHRSCTPCPSGTSTLTLGSVGNDSCLKKCPLGSYTDVRQNDCLPCPSGEWDIRADPNEIQTSCRKCAPGKGHCWKTCPPGFFAEFKNRACQPCPIGTYLSKGRNRRNSQDKCAICPNGTTTETTGAADPSLCGCPPGQFSSGNSCTACPSGTSKSVFGTQACSRSTTDQTTSTSATWLTTTPSSATTTLTSQQSSTDKTVAAIVITVASVAGLVATAAIAILIRKTIARRQAPPKPKQLDRLKSASEAMLMQNGSNRSLDGLHSPLSLSRSNERRFQKQKQVPLAPTTMLSSVSGSLKTSMVGERPAMSQSGTTGVIAPHATVVTASELPTHTETKPDMDIEETKISVFNEAAIQGLKTDESLDVDTVELQAPNATPTAPTYFK